MPIEYDQTAVWAHRGWSAKYPENTVAAFRAAMDIGAHGIELDVHLTKDGEIVVIHDETVDRTTDGKGRVADLTLAELRQLDAGGWFKPAFKGERIPTLREVLTLVREYPRHVWVNIELKTDVIPYKGLEERTLALVHQHGLQEQVIYSSFNHKSVVAIKQMSPRAPIGLLYMEPLIDVERYALHTHAQAVHPYMYSIDKHQVQACHQHGIAVHVFTPNDSTNMKRLIRWGVDAVITDKPDKMLRILQSGGRL